MASSDHSLEQWPPLLGVQTSAPQRPPPDPHSSALSSAPQRPSPDPLIPPAKGPAEPSTETMQGQARSYASLVGPTSRPPATPVQLEPRPAFASMARPKLAFRFPPLQLPARTPAIKDGKPIVFFTNSEIQPGVQRLHNTR
ncbi:unnamed protein product [Rhodiola kirilowii]